MNQTEQRRVLFLVPSLNGGGAEYVAINLLEQLDRSRFRPQLVLMRREGPFLVQVPKDVPVHDLGGSLSSSKAYYVRQLKAAVTDLEPDLVLSFLNQANVIALLTKLVGRQKFKLIISVHNNLAGKFSDRPPLKRRAKEIFVERVYPYADHIVAVSEGIKNDLIHNYGLPPIRTSTIYNPIEVEKIRTMARAESTELEPRGQAKLVVAIGSLVLQKGFGDLIKAFALVRRQVPARLLILGEGPLRPELEATIGALCLTNYVVMPGFVANPYPYMTQADLFVLSSLWEGFGVVVVEAMACGTPVIAADCDYGPGEIVTHGQNGSLVPVGDIDKLSQAMIRLLSNESEASRLRAGGLRRADDFDSASICRRYEALFEAVLGG